MVLDGVEGLKCKVYEDWICLEHVLEFKYFFDVFWTNQVLMRHSVVGRWRMGGV